MSAEGTSLLRALGAYLPTLLQKKKKKRKEKQEKEKKLEGGGWGVLKHPQKILNISRTCDPLWELYPTIPQNGCVFAFLLKVPSFLVTQLKLLFLKLNMAMPRTCLSN